MTNEEAKFQLSAYRPGGADASDPAMAEALAQAKRDPALAAWFERQQSHDAAVAAKLREIPPPAGLREAILAGARASQPAARGHALWRRARWIGAAAAAVLLALGAWWQLVPVRGPTFEEFALNFVDHGFRLQKHSGEIAVLQAWLADRQQPLPQALPAEFSRLRALGCRTLEYDGRAVSLMCFERGGKEFHVFVMRREPRDTATPAAPLWLERRSLVAAAWSDAANRYVLVSDAALPAVKQLL